MRLTWSSFVRFKPAAFITDASVTIPRPIIKATAALMCGCGGVSSADASGGGSWSISLGRGLETFGASVADTTAVNESTATALSDMTATLLSGM